MSRRRVHVSKLQAGVTALAASESRHVRDVLRMGVNDNVEVFDDDGATAQGKLIEVRPDCVRVEVSLIEVVQPSTELIVASAIPKGDRADWLVEKLSELGVTRFIPLATERSVVLPTGKNKADRWARLATESAKQSRRAGVMRIEPLTQLDVAIGTATNGILLSTEPDARPLIESLQSALRNPRSAIALFIGPEGGWTDAELDRFSRAGLTPARLTATILRVETAAVAAAAIAAALIDSRPGDQRSPS